MESSNPEKPVEEAKEEEEECRDVSFEELGLDPRFTWALANLNPRGQGRGFTGEDRFWEDILTFFPCSKSSSWKQVKERSPHQVFLFLCQQGSFASRVPLKAVQLTASMPLADMADLLLSYGYEDDIKSLIPHVPRQCQCLLMSTTSSSDVEKLKKLVLHNPVTLTLYDVVHPNDEIISKNVQQFYISCSDRDRLLHLLALLKLGLVQKKKC